MTRRPDEAARPEGDVRARGPPPVEPPAPPGTLTVFVRPRCSLCEAALALLDPEARRAGVAVRTVDVETDAGLEAAFGERVPVGVAPDGSELFELALDPRRIVDVVARCARGSS